MSYQYGFEQWLLIFYLYSFLGWWFESIVVSLQQKPIRWINRGFLRGTFLPLYGSGAVVVLVLSLPLREHIVLVYLAGVVGGTVLEYVTGVMMEKTFKIRYWDYDKRFLNFQGIICLRSSLVWGVLTIFLAYFLQPIINIFIFDMPLYFMKYGMILITIYIVADCALSVRAALDLRDILVKMESVRSEIESLQKRMDQVQSSLNNRFGFVQENLNNRINGMQVNMEQRIDIMSEKVEERLNAFREFRNLQLRMPRMEDQDEQEKNRNEMLSIRDRLLVVKTRMSDLKDIRGRIKLRMILNNPTMKSIRFPALFEELHDTVLQRMGIEKTKEEQEEKKDKEE